jgi:enolase
MAYFRGVSKMIVDEDFIITFVKGLWSIDSRGTPTVKAIIKTRKGIGVALAPSGASKGVKEAVELRDGGRKWLGKGVGLAIARIDKVIAPKLRGMDSRKQVLIDNLLLSLDGTKNKSVLGGNATTAVSIAVAKAAANTAHMALYEYLGGPHARILPTPLMNVINGGVHAGNKLDLQEFMIIPVNAESFLDALRIGVECYGNLKEILKETYGLTAINVGDEGGYAPPLSKTREALDLLIKSIKRAGYVPGEDVLLGIDAASSQFYNSSEKVYVLNGEGLKLSSEELLDYYMSLIDEYPIKYLEDPFAEDDVEAYERLASKMFKKLIVVGDDLYCTNPEILRVGIEKKLTNGALLKVNQVGTLTEALEYARIALSSGLRLVVSHRSGETEDPFISDLSVALGSGLIKTGAPARGERTAKYNRLIEIEYELGPVAVFAGIRPFKGL